MSADIKQAVTVAEMARMVGLSRARFYQLIGTAFPHPIYAVAKKRPFFNEELQKVCLEVRRRNCGIDGKPVMFYARRLDLPTPRRQSPSVKKTAKYTSLIAGLAGLGLSGVTEGQVQASVQKLYPNGTDGVDDPTQLRTLFVHLMRQDREHNVLP